MPRLGLSSANGRHHMRSPIIVGTAGWSIPRAVADKFPSVGSTLSRYADRFAGVEINSTFYHRHRASTYVRWRDSVPSTFRFAVKIPRLISHEKRLVGVDSEFVSFLDETAELGQARGPILLQLPPSFAFDERVADAFFALVRKTFDGDVVIEPRHKTWLAPEAEALLVSCSISRAGADPSPLGVQMTPGGWPGISYLRLHGSPKIYYSAYNDYQLRALADRLKNGDERRWIIFDNTASGAAAKNALDFKCLLRSPPAAPEGCP